MHYKDIQEKFGKRKALGSALAIGQFVSNGISIAQNNWAPEDMLTGGICAIAVLMVGGLTPLATTPYFKAKKMGVKTGSFLTQATQIAAATIASTALYFIVDGYVKSDKTVQTEPNRTEIKAQSHFTKNQLRPL